MIYDLIIIGSGAAGLSAAIYAGRYRLKVIVFGKEFGGETTSAGAIENYPGAPSIQGYELMNLMKKQASDLGAEIADGEVDRIERHGHCFKIFVDNNEYQAKTIILALGSERLRLGLPNEKELTGHGVHYCITCDAPLYVGKTLAVVGGGDASVKGANLAAQYVKEILLLVRGKEVIAEPINYQQMQKLGGKIKVLLETEVKKIIGGEKLEKIILSKEYNGSKELVVDGLFVEIGAKPNVALAKSLGVELDEHGYIKVNNMMKTNIDGVFAAGDTVNHFGRFKQDITAAAMGAVAATSAYEDYKIHGELCTTHLRPAIPIK
jgi:thioredoxin reductase (NADPH)